MRLLKSIRRVISTLSITTKLSVSFGLLLVIILIEMGVGFGALNLVWDSTGAIQVNAEIQRLVLNMRGNWESTQRLQKEFFHQSGLISGEQAYKLYALPASVKIDEIIRDGASLKQINKTYAASSPLIEKDAELNFILSNISQYASTLQEATDLELQMTTDGTGLEEEMNDNARVLYSILQSIDQPRDMPALYYQIRFNDMEYLDNRSESSLAASATALEHLRHEITVMAQEPDGKTPAVSALDDFESVREKVFTVDASIREKTAALDSLGQSMDPIMIELMTTINGDMVKNRLLIEQTRRVTGTILVGVMLAAFIATVIIALGMHHGITRKVVRLNQVARQFQKGNLDARAPVGGTDELGQLAYSFNDMASQLSQTIDQTRQLAEHDHLTGLYNRMGFWSAGKREIKRCLRFNRPLSLLFLDIDHFKNFNDSYTYETGDRVLIQLAGCLMEDLRDIDLVGRYGGEEFVVLLPEVDLAEAADAAERLRKDIETRQLHTNFGPLAITVSIGLSAFTPEKDGKPPLSEEGVLNRLIEQGGEMLHKAKAEGRNRIAAPQV